MYLDFVQTSLSIELELIIREMYDSAPLRFTINIRTHLYETEFLRLNSISYQNFGKGRFYFKYVVYV